MKYYLIEVGSDHLRIKAAFCGCLLFEARGLFASFGSAASTTADTLRSTAVEFIHSKLGKGAERMSRSNDLFDSRSIGLLGSPKTGLVASYSTGRAASSVDSQSFDQSEGWAASLVDSRGFGSLS